MLDFLLIISKGSAAGQELSGLLPKVPGLRAARTDTKFYHNAASVRAWIWHTSVEPFRSVAQSVDSGEVLRVYQGYAISPSGSAVKTVEQFRNAAASELLGDFFYLESNQFGNGKIQRSKISSYQIYYGENENNWVVSSRAMITGSVLAASTKPQVNPAFIRWTLSYGVCSNYEAMFDSVKFLGLDESLTWGPSGLTVHSSGPAHLLDHELQYLFRKDRKAYWDLAFERLTTVTKSVDLTSDKIEFPLSGGKDSRLLFGLLIASGRKHRLGRVYTNGPEVSPEVRAARDICRAFNINHEHVDRTTVTSKKDIILSDKLLTHLLITEGEISPMDLFWQRGISNKTQLHGQEGGLRNIAGNRKFSTRAETAGWFRSHLGGGDMCNIFKPGVADANLADIETFLDQIAAAEVPWSEAPTLHRIRYRLARWVGRTWKAYNETSFAPYIFVNSEVISMTVNAGSDSRTSEEFHFEMLRRVDPRLIEIPFADQSWMPEMLNRSGLSIHAPEPYKWPEGVRTISTRPTHEALHTNIDKVTDFISSSAGPAVSSIVDFDRLSRFNHDNLKSGHYQPIWQAVQAVICEQTKDLLALSDDALSDQLPACPPVDVRVIVSA